MANFEAGRCCIRELRVKKGWSQETLSELAGVPRSTISSLETNKYVCEDLPTAHSIAQALGCSMDDLYKWTRV